MNNTKSSLKESSSGDVLEGVTYMLFYRSNQKHMQCCTLISCCSLEVSKSKSSVNLYKLKKAYLVLYFKMLAKTHPVFFLYLASTHQKQTKTHQVLYCKKLAKTSNLIPSITKEEYQ